MSYFLFCTPSHFRDDFSSSIHTSFVHLPQHRLDWSQPPLLPSTPHISWLPMSSSGHGLLQLHLLHVLRADQTHVHRHLRFKQQNYTNVLPIGRTLLFKSCFSHILSAWVEVCSLPHWALKRPLATPLILLSFSCLVCKSPLFFRQRFKFFKIVPLLHQAVKDSCTLQYRVDLVSLPLNSACSDLPISPSSTPLHVLPAPPPFHCLP